MNDQKPPFSLEYVSLAATKWIGSVQSLVVHTVAFVVAFVLIAVGIPVDRVLLVLTTVVSLEAIYLSILIQMSVNRNEAKLAEVSEDIDEIQEDVEHIEKDIDEIQEDVEHIEKDIDEIQEDVDEINEEIEEDESDEHMDQIRKTLAKLVRELEEVKKKPAKKAVKKQIPD